MDIKITRLGHLGDGIAEGPLFAARTLPGEVVTGTPKGDRLTDIRVVTPSEHRIKAPCAHYNACGGCALQHADDGFVAAWKRDVVHTALAAQGLTTAPDPTETSPTGTRRRATLHGRRTKKGALVGFHARAADTLTPVPQCMLLDPALLAVVPTLETLTRIAASRAAEVAYHLTLSDSGVDLAIENAKPLDADIRAALPPYGAAFARVTWNGEPVLQAAAPGVRFGSARVVPPPGAFLQATPEGEAALVRATLDAIGPAKRVIDLFSGCGTFTFPAAAQAAVHAIESERDLLDALNHGVRHNQDLKPITTERRDLFRNPVLPEDLTRYDAAIIDPPRAGAETQIAELAQSTVPRIAFVSCNPVTFAREAATLVQAGYCLNWVRVIDQFRWSPHIETVASFSKD
jgi:23S rRNA (uracil1939-C5)-methyltransferase